VTARGNRWAAQICYDGKRHRLGSFATKQEAAICYDREARKCGKNKPLNYESIAAVEEAEMQAQAATLVLGLCANTTTTEPRPRPTSGFYGVYITGKRWQAEIRGISGGKQYLGNFDTKPEAALAYDREARQRGQVKLLNYQSIAAAEEAAAHAQVAHTLAHPQQPQQPKPRPSSGFYGVYAISKPRKQKEKERKQKDKAPIKFPWKAQIRYDKKGHFLGAFDTKQEAALAYDREARQCGTDMPLNYDSIAAAEEAAAHAQAEHIPVHDIYTLANPKQPKPRPASGFHGVTVSAKRWRAMISYDGKEYILGTFDTKEEAALAFDRKARQCGKDKLLNYESIAAAEEAAVHARADHTLTLKQPKEPKPRPASGFYGVCASRKRWMANVCYTEGASRIHPLGSFDTKEEAALAYDRKVRQCGKDKPLNYESIKAAEEAAAEAKAEYIPPLVYDRKTRQHRYE
jgi:hypothetical protein